MTIESWQIYHVALKKLPSGTLQRIYRRSSRLVNYWAADPRYVDEIKLNPIDRIRKMIFELDTAGYGDYARAAIDYMAKPLGGCFEDKEPVVSDKGSVDGETSDVAIAFGKLADEIRFAMKDNEIDAAEQIRIKGYARELKRQVDELMDAAGIAE